MMRTAQVLTVFLVGLLATMSPVQAQGRDEAAVLFEAAIQTELVDGDLTKAVGLYADILARFSSERPIAAEALLHIGQSYEKLGEPQAREAYERLLRDYADQRQVVAAARAGLAALVEIPPEIEVPEGPHRDVWTRPPPALASIGLNGRYLIFSDIAVHNLRTGENRRLTSGARSAAYPVLSPDGQQVAYLSWSGDLEENFRNARTGRAVRPTAGLRSSAELRIVSLDGSGDRVLVDAEKVPWIQPFAWSPDGQQILAVFERGSGAYEIVLVSAADGSARVLKSMGWRYPQEMSFSPDGRYVAYGLPASRNSRRRDIFVLPVDDTLASSLGERRYSLTFAGESAQRLTDDQQIVGSIRVSQRYLGAFRSFSWVT